MSSFIEELRQRRVYRVAAGYAVIAWLIIQAAAIVFPIWELPTWSLRLVIVLVLIGFPVALLLAWAFEVRSSGIHAVDTSGSESWTPRSRRNVFALCALGVLISIGAGFFLLPAPLPTGWRNPSLCFP